MNTMNVKRRAGSALVAIVGLGVAFAVTASANCGISVDRYTTPRFPAAAIPEAVSPAHVSPVSAAQDDATAGSIVGLWKTMFISGGTVVDQGFDQWSSDGTEILNDDPPPSTGNVCLGVYVKSGSVYKLKHPSWTYDASGNLTGTAVIREQLALLPGGNGYAGTFAISFYDLSGNNVGNVAGTVAAQRITVDF